MPRPTTIEALPDSASGDLAGALADYSKAIELKPDYAEALNVSVLDLCPATAGRSGPALLRACGQN